MLNTTLEILPSPEGLLHDLTESQANSITLLRRRFARHQLEVSIEANGRLRGWIIAGKTREVKLNGLPAYVNLKKATQLLEQSYLKLQKETIEVLPKGLGGGMKYSRPSSTLESNRTTTCEKEALKLVEAIPNNKNKRIVQKVVEVLLKNDLKELMQSLDFAGNQIGDAGAQALGAALQINHTLQSLGLFNTQIGIAGAQALGAALQINHTLQSLDLHWNTIGDAGAQALGDALQVNQSLQSLNLGYTQIGNMGVQALGTALQINQSLQSLNLEGNLIDNDGVQMLGAALEVNQSLQSLNLAWNNGIGDASAQAIGVALQVNQSLQLLNLKSNRIGDTGAQALGAALQVNQSLQSLYLLLNPIGTKGARALETALQVNHTLQTLNLDWNKISDVEMVAKNRTNILLQANKQLATTFQQEIKEVQNFLQSHPNNESIALEYLPQLKELLQKWHSNSKDLIPSLQEILQQSGRTNLNDRYKEKLEGTITDLTNRLHNLWLEPFEEKVAALSNQYVMGKEFSEERNVNLGYALYETWLTFLGSDYPHWAEDYIQSLIPFGVLLDIAEGGKKKDVTDLTDAHLLFERVLAFRNESKNSLCSLTTQS